METFFYTDLHYADSIKSYLDDFVWNEMMQRELDSEAIPIQDMERVEWLIALLANRILFKEREGLIFLREEETEKKYLVEIKNDKIIKMYFTREQLKDRKKKSYELHKLNLSICERVCQSLVRDIEDEDTRQVVLQIYLKGNIDKMRTLGILDFIKDREESIARIYLEENNIII